MSRIVERETIRKYNKFIKLLFLGVEIIDKVFFICLYFSSFLLSLHFDLYNRAKYVANKTQLLETIMRLLWKAPRKILQVSFKEA